MRIIGCKAYSVSKTLHNGETVSINKLKGFSKNSYDENGVPIKNVLSVEDYDSLIDGDIISQNQLQLSCNKNEMMRDGDKFRINHNIIHKSFKALYTKGTYDESELKEKKYVDIFVQTYPQRQGPAQGPAVLEILA